MGRWRSVGARSQCPRRCDDGMGIGTGIGITSILDVLDYLDYSAMRSTRARWVSKGSDQFVGLKTIYIEYAG